jgi:hypothetical protein
MGSYAIFSADDSGTVDPKVQPLTLGTYEGIDPAGLFWRIMPVSNNSF